jgi:hypothetical protein
VGLPRGIPLTVTLTTSISASAQIVNGDASMGQQLAQKWCSDCHAVGAEDAEAYGSVPLRAHSDGWLSIPRAMPLLLQIMDNLSKGKPVSSAYLDLWCRTYDDSLIVANKSREMAFFSGFTGERAERTMGEPYAYSCRPWIHRHR